MASKIQIINMALTHLNVNTITSLTENNPSAALADVFWDNALDDVFSEHSWPFATVKEQLAETSEEVIGWEYTYAYPSKSARVHYVFDEATAKEGKEDNEFEVVFIKSTNKRLICTDLVDAYCEYTYKVTDTSLWDAKFTVSFSYKLAALMAHKATGEAKYGLEMGNLFSLSIDDAKRLSFQEKIKKPFRKSSAYDAR